MIGRAAAGLLLAAAIAAAARRARSLTRSGAIAATIVGTICIAAGWSWGALLVVFFLSSTALSHWRAAVKARRTEGIVAKGGERDAWQVVANGVVFALAAALALLVPWPGWPALAAGALATAAADTWGTEVGTLAARAPRLITTWRAVPPGTSGGVSLPGLAATVAGAGLIAAAALALGWPAGVAGAALAGGIAGALADSLVGALWQARRRCPECGTYTERAVHACGATTARAGGARWLDNDGVNLVSGLAGALVALLVAR